jgi:formate dehydrogenase iron-sulfur subunit
VTISSARGELTVKAVVTPRMKPLKSAARRSRSSGCPTTGASRAVSGREPSTHLTIDATDPGAGTQETKACLVNVVKAPPSATREAGKAREESMSEAAPSNVPVRTTLIDIANCIGCRACQVACKQWNEMEGEDTELQAHMGFQNPATLSAKTYTLISFHEVDNPKKAEGFDNAFVMRRCFHCLEPGCVSACPTTALYRQPDGPVAYDAAKCIGCRYCMLACPWDVPTAEWDKLAPEDREVHALHDRTSQPAPIAFNGVKAPEAETKRFLDTIATPACVKACPGRRAALRHAGRDARDGEEAHRGPADKYVDHVYGEKELGGTTVLYVSPVPFDKLGFPTFGEKPYPKFTAAALGAVPPAVMAIGALLGAAYAFFRKRVQAVADGSGA